MYVCIIYGVWLKSWRSVCSLGVYENWEDGGMNLEACVRERQMRPRSTSMHERHPSVTLLSLVNPAMFCTYSFFQNILFPSSLSTCFQLFFFLLPLFFHCSLTPNSQIIKRRQMTPLALIIYLIAHYFG
jgi:hypothetical protein